MGARTVCVCVRDGFSLLLALIHPASLLLIANAIHIVAALFIPCTIVTNKNSSIVYDAQNGVGSTSDGRRNA